MPQEHSGEAAPAASHRAHGLGAARLDALRAVLPGWFRRAFRADPEMVLFAARVGVWMRWFVYLVAIIELAYRPGFWLSADREYLFIFLLMPLVVFNGLVHQRLHMSQTVTWRWLLFLSAMDVALITASVTVSGKFHHFVYVAYFPALAFFAAIFASLGFCLLWTTAVAALYLGVSVTVTGLDLDAGQEKALFARVAAMYGIVLCVSLITRFERARLQRAGERERELHRQRAELSQVIHDTAAQNAYMVSMGIHRAMRLTGDSNQELKSALEATSVLSKAAVWELRRPLTKAICSRVESLAGCSGPTPRISSRLPGSPRR